jgi:hypothetical protein
VNSLSAPAIRDALTAVLCRTSAAVVVASAAGLASERLPVAGVDLPLLLRGKYVRSEPWTAADSPTSI